MKLIKSGIAVGAAALLSAGAVSADDVKIGSLSAITGPIVSLTAEINAAERAAIADVNKAGGILGKNAVLVEADSACNPQTAVDAANKLINVEQVTAIVGGLCSAVTIASMSNVAKNAGVVMVSPASTSPDITKLADNDLLFRVVPSDAFQGKILSKMLMDRGVKKVALTYINNDYGNGFAKSFRNNFSAAGGMIAGDQVHEEGKASYRSELATLSKGGAETLVVLAMGDGSGMTIMKQSLESGLFSKFVGGDGMRAQSIVDQLGAANMNGAFTGTVPTSIPSKEADAFKAMYGDDKAFKYDSAYTHPAYDAAFVIALAIEAAGSNDRAKIAASLRKVATAPGVKIGPGADEFARAKKLLAEGKDIDYDGVAGPHEFDGDGEVVGVYADFLVKGGKLMDGGLLK